MKDLAKMVGEKLNINPEHIEFSISSRTEFEAVGMKERAIDVKRRVAYSTKLFALEIPSWICEASEEEVIGASVKLSVMSYATRTDKTLQKIYFKKSMTTREVHFEIFRYFRFLLDRSSRK